MSRRYLRTGQASLLIAAGCSVVAAVAMDVLAQEHPSHTLGLGTVAVVVATLRIKLAGRYEGVLSAVSGALVAQPALHATSRMEHATVTTSLDGPLHVAVSDGPVTVAQVVVPSVAVTAVALCSRLLAMLLGELVPTTRPREAAVAATNDVRSVRTPRLGSMLHWCGWTIRTARRGPPVPSGSVTS